MIKILEVPPEMYFKQGDIVQVGGEMKSGLGKVFMAYYPTEQPKGELSYGMQYDQPFPQLGIVFEDGTRIHYNAGDLLAGKITHPIQVSLSSSPLLDILKAISVDYSQAASDLGDEDNPTMINTLWDTLGPTLQEVVRPLLTHLCFWPDERSFDLGELDRETVIIKSENRGSMMRNDGVHAFILEITVDGYAPTTINLLTSEVLR